MPTIQAEALSLASVTATIERRSGDTFAPSTGGMVKPGEAIRLLVSGVKSQIIQTPEFIVQDADGNEILRQNAGATLSGDAWLDWQAPLAEGTYTFIVNYQSYPFLPFTSQVRTTMVVSSAAPEPPAAPPSNTWGRIENIVKWVAIGGAVVGVVYIGGKVLGMFGGSKREVVYPVYPSYQPAPPARR